MAHPVAASTTGRPRGEEADAAYRAVMAVTAASGAMIALFSGFEGSVPVTAAPTVVLLGGLARRSTTLSAWSGVGVWGALLGMASGLALVAPLLMIVLCLAFAVGPDRLLDWVRDEWTGRGTEPHAGQGWIEDDR
jgi:hypothetical protein